MDTDEKVSENKNSLLFRYKHFSAEAKGVLGTFSLSFLCFLLMGFVLKFM